MLFSLLLYTTQHTTLQVVIACSTTTSDREVVVLSHAGYGRSRSVGQLLFAP